MCDQTSSGKWYEDGVLMSQLDSASGSTVATLLVWVKRGCISCCIWIGIGRSRGRDIGDSISTGEGT